MRAARLSRTTSCRGRPGLGSLTLALLPEVRRVVAVEVDAVLAGALPATVADRAPGLADRLEVVHADAMKITDVPGPPPTALVANLPYNVAVPVVLHLLAALPSLRSALVMVQAEVADRMVAPPGDRLAGAVGQARLVRGGAPPGPSGGRCSGPRRTWTRGSSPSPAVSRRHHGDRERCSR